MAGKQEIRLEPPGQMAAVLDSEQDLPEPGNPLERMDMTGRSGLDGDLVRPASQLGRARRTSSRAGWGRSAR